MTGPRNRPIEVAVVAPTMGILGGHAVQAHLLLESWSRDDEVRARLVPINPVPPAPFDRALRVRYARTFVTQATYWPHLVREFARADLVHVFSAGYTSFLLAPLPALIVARAWRRPVILNYHSGEGPDHLRGSWIARRAIATANRVVVPSRFLADAFATFGIAARVIPNMVDVDRFAFRQPRGGARVLSTRNFEPLYNVSCTLRAFRWLQDARPDASLTIVGRGSEDRRLHQLCDELALRHVRFLGRVEPESMPATYAEADVYIQTPDIDNMPLSVLEAWSTGLPVISTNAGGVPGMVRDGVDALLVPCNDDRAAGEQLVRVTSDVALARELALAGRESAGRHTRGPVTESWRETYRSVLGEASAATAAARAA